VDRTKEHLSSSDVAVVQVRRGLLRALERTANGQWPVGSRAPESHRDVVPTDEVISSESPEFTAPVSSRNELEA
jgi:hypothetical protein